MQQIPENVENKGTHGGKRKGAGRPKKEENNQKNQVQNQVQNQEVKVIYKNNKAKYWTVVVYNENLKEDWTDELEKIGLPMSYCVHNKTKVNGEDRKTHTHIIVAFPNTTTYNHAFKMFERLNADGKSAFNKLEEVYSIQNAYNYLIHDTDDCRRKEKEPYDASERKDINNFDIGAYIQLSTEEQEEIIDSLADIIIAEGFTNFIDFYDYVSKMDNKEYKRLVRKNSGFFERLTKGNYQKFSIKNDCY